MSSGKKESKGPQIYKHWKRPHTRMYDYNYQVAESYYKPQVHYSNYLDGPGKQGRRVRRRSVSPPPPQSFLERWAANPFYGKELDSIDLEREELVRARNRARSMTRASSIPHLEPGWFEKEEEIEKQRALRSSMSRARSVLSYADDRDFRGDYDDYMRLRGTRARSVSTVRPMDDMDVDWEWARDRDFDDLVRTASRDEREKSIFNMRMALDPDFGKQLMTTTLSHGVYKNSLYGTETWDPSTYLAGRQ